MLSVFIVPAHAKLPDRTESQTQIHVSDLNSPDVTIGVPLGGSTEVAVREQIPLANIVLDRSYPKALLNILQPPQKGSLEFPGNKVICQMGINGR